MKSMLFFQMTISALILFWVYGLNLVQYLSRDFDGIHGNRLTFTGTGHRVQFLSMYFLHYMLAVLVVVLMFVSFIPLGEHILGEGVAALHTIIRLCNMLLVAMFIWEQVMIRTLPIHKNQVDKTAGRLLQVRTKYHVISESMQMLMLVNLAYIVITWVKLFPYVYPPSG